MPEESNKEEIMEERLMSMRANSQRREGEEFFWMKRVPSKTVEEFKEIAKESCNDYGMVLKLLVDYYKEYKIRNMILEKFLTHDIMIMNLSNKVDTIINYRPTKPEKVMIGGNKLGEEKKVEEIKNEQDKQSG